jgi:hypothetical protein
VAALTPSSEPRHDSRETWTTWREALEIIVVPAHLRATLAVAAVVGTLLLIINQLDAVVQGHVDLTLLFKAVLTYVVPFIVSNYGLLAATRRRRHHRHAK